MANIGRRAKQQEQKQRVCGALSVVCMIATLVLYFGYAAAHDAGAPVDIQASMAVGTVIAFLASIVAIIVAMVD